MHLKSHRTHDRSEAVDEMSSLRSEQATCQDEVERVVLHAETSNDVCRRGAERSTGLDEDRSGDCVALLGGEDHLRTEHRGIDALAARRLEERDHGGDAGSLAQETGQRRLRPPPDVGGGDRGHGCLRHLGRAARVAEQRAHAQRAELLAVGVPARDDRPGSRHHDHPVGLVRPGAERGEGIVGDPAGAGDPDRRRDAREEMFVHREVHPREREHRGSDAAGLQPGGVESLRDTGTDRSCRRLDPHVVPVRRILVRTDPEDLARGVGQDRVAMGAAALHAEHGSHAATIRRPGPCSAQ